VLASLVVLLFMRSWRSTFIAAGGDSNVGDFDVRHDVGLKLTLNSVTMLALVLMVGIVIDDAIVVLENIFRFVEEKKMGAFQAARAATAEIALAVMATTLSLVVIFVPVSFMSSVAGRFLFQFGLTAAVAVLVSPAGVVTLTPMMSARLFDAASLEDAIGHEHARSRIRFLAWIDRFYQRVLEWAMAHRQAIVILAAAACSLRPAVPVVRQEFTPGDTGRRRVRGESHRAGRHEP